ncbi:MAG: phosphoenolpyruvate--protein phosphotransferase [Myxococcota bacterium]
MSGRSSTFHGIGASPGVTIGRVFLLDRRQIRIPRYHIQPDQVDYEISRLQTAIDQSIEQLESVRAKFVGDGMDHQKILEAHELMLRDQSLIDEASALIREQQRNAEWAINKVIGRLRSLLEGVRDPYFRERRGDIDFIGERILRNLVGRVVEADLGSLDAGSVVVAHDLSPVDTALLSRHRVTALVTELGGKTSHTSIVARSLGVAAVVGVHGIFEAAGNADMILVDGIKGTVIVRPTRAHLEKGRRRAASYQQLNVALVEARALPAHTPDGFEISVAGNIELPNEVATVIERGGDAIGLYRTEFMFLGRSTPPGEEDHYRTYCQIFDEIGDRPVTVRTLDLGGEKAFDSAQKDSEPNPALGLRAIRYCLAHPELFEAQIAGLLRAAPRGNLRIMLPMVSGVDELRAARQLIKRTRERLCREGKEFQEDVPVGIMIEVPSAVMIADLLAQEADFFSIGTNDLLQYLLAIDRTNDRVAYLYHPLHPAVLRTLQLVRDAARNANIPVSICGEVAGDPEHIAILIGFGFQQLSMNAGSIPRIKRMVRALGQAECEGLLNEALNCATWPEVDALVRDFLSSKELLAHTVWAPEEP